MLEQQWAQGDDPLVGRLRSARLDPVDDLRPAQASRSCTPAARHATTASRSCRAPTAPTWRRARATTDGTQLPGQIGNFAVAGHRVGKGEPFLNLDQLRAGDAVVVETKVHLVRLPGAGRPATGDPTVARTRTGCPGGEIVTPDRRRRVIAAGAQPSGCATDRGALMTMTTCHPKFTATQRMIVHAVLRPRPCRCDRCRACPRRLYAGGTI